MMKYSIVLLLSIFCLVSCAKISYQERNEFVPNGYSDAYLEDNTYRVMYETYKEKGDEDLLVKMAKYRAAELTLEQQKTYFEVVSVDFTEDVEDYDVPEQKITHVYGGRSSGAGHSFASIDLPTITEETIIPAHVRQFKVKRADMVVKLYADQNNDRVIYAQSVIDEGVVR